MKLVIIRQTFRSLIGIVDLIDIPPNTVCALLPKRHLPISRGDSKNVPKKDSKKEGTVRALNRSRTHPLMDQDTRHTGDEK